jgi:restriction endonuclease S subunit
LLCNQVGVVVILELSEPITLPHDVVDARFFVSVWNSAKMRLWIEDKAKTTSGIWKINQSHTESAQMPLPSISEQQRIVRELDTLREKVNSVKALQSETAAELDAMLPATLDKAFKGEL